MKLKCSEECVYGDTVLSSCMSQYLHTLTTHTKVCTVSPQKEYTLLVCSTQQVKQLGCRHGLFEMYVCGSVALINVFCYLSHNSCVFSHTTLHTDSTPEG